MAAETKKTEEKDIKEKESNGNFIEGVRSYFSDVRTELKKVSWPSREDVTNLTRIVAVVIVLASLVMGLLSALLNYIINDTHFADLLAMVNLNRVPVFVLLFAAILGGTWYMFNRESQKSY
jgi:preprotein translocase subunit SecE